MPRSRHARMTRRAISPRLATRMRWNIWVFRTPRGFRGLGRIDAEQHLIEFDRLRVLYEDFDDDAAATRLQLVVGFHDFDQTDHFRRRDAVAELDVRRLARLRLGIVGTD